jgi:hypothetical protein
MFISRKAILALLVGVAPLAGCAYDYGYGYDRYGYYGAPSYYDPYYYGPSVGLGLGYTYYERDGRRYYRDRDGREWRARDRDGQREWVDRNNDSRPDPVVPDGVNRGGDLGTGRDPRQNPNMSPG